MKKRSTISLLLFCLLSIAPIAEASDLFGTIRLSGQPLRNTELSLKSETKEVKAKTNESGYYSIRNLEAGNYTMTIQLPDKKTRQERVYVFPQSTEKNIELK